MIKKTNYNNLDLAKFICSLLVVIIHTSPFIDIAPEFNFFLVNIIARVAVPLFFSMSGFLLFKPMVYHKEKVSKSFNNLCRLQHYWFKIARLYLCWSIAYLLIIKIPLWYTTGWWGMYVIKDTVASFFLAGTHYHLWYLLSMIDAVPIVFLLRCYLSRKAFLFLIVLLWFCECLTYSYSWVGLEHFSWFIWISERMPIVFDTLFRAVPLIAIGALAAQQEKQHSITELRNNTVIFFLLCIAEAYMLRAFTPNNSKFSYLFFTPFLAFYLLCFLLSIPSIGWQPSKSKFIREISTVVYCLHPMIIDLLRNRWELSAYLLCLMTTVISIVIATIFSKYRMCIENRGS